MKDILVIHPKDSTTDCLCALYENRTDCDVIRDPSASSEFLTEEIINHNKILLLGHGTPYGLLAYANNSRFGRYIVDTTFWPLFENSNKQVWSVWCNSDQYFSKIDCPGIHTGMIISERGEEFFVLNEAPLSIMEMEENMKLFCEAFRKNLNFDNPEQARDNILTEYVGTDKVTQFNRENIIVL